MCDNLLLVFLVSLGYSKAMLRYIFTLLLITQVKSCTFFFPFYCLVCLCTCGLYNLNNWHSSARKTKELRSMSTVPNKFIFPQPNSTKNSKQTATDSRTLETCDTVCIYLSSSLDVEKWKNKRRRVNITIEASWLCPTRDWWSESHPTDLAHNVYLDDGLGLVVVAAAGSSSSTTWAAILRWEA